MTITQLQEKVAENYKCETKTAEAIMRKIVDEIVEETVAVLSGEGFITTVKEEEK